MDKKEQPALSSAAVFGAGEDPVSRCARRRRAQGRQLHVRPQGARHSGAIILVIVILQASGVPVAIRDWFREVTDQIAGAPFPFFEPLNRSYAGSPPLPKREAAGCVCCALWISMQAFPDHSASELEGRCLVRNRHMRRVRSGRPAGFRMLIVTVTGHLQVAALVADRGEVDRAEDGIPVRRDTCAAVPTTRTCRLAVERSAVLPSGTF